MDISLEGKILLDDLWCDDCWFLMLAVPKYSYGNERESVISAMGIDTTLGAMEGKEIRVGACSIWILEYCNNSYQQDRLTLCTIVQCHYQE
nr:hypothetical protein [Candidatus Brachybacter algidus]